MKKPGYEIVIIIMMGTIVEIPLPDEWDFDSLLDKKVKTAQLEILCEVLEDMIREYNIPVNRKKELAKSLEMLARDYNPISNSISKLLALL